MELMAKVTLLSAGEIQPNPILTQQPGVSWCNTSPAVKSKHIEPISLTVLMLTRADIQSPTAGHACVAGVTCRRHRKASHSCITGRRHR